MHNSVEIENLSKSFRLTRWKNFRRSITEVPAVNDISLVIPEGQSVAFIGPNGAGKSCRIKWRVNPTVAALYERRVFLESTKYQRS